MIHAQNLRREFRTGDGVVEAVRGIDLDVAPGEMVAFLGPNGAGKSTTLRMFTTLLAPSDGRATVAGQDIRRDPVSVRRAIGSVGQGNGSYDGVRAEDELYAQGRFYGLDRGTARARTVELLDRFGLSGQGRQDVANLSGGQRRRLDVAMGLINRPRLLFLDEPTAGLDPQSRANLWEHVTRLRDEQELTIFLTTHYLDEADSVAERVIVIDDGRIIADGTPDQLKATVSGDLVRVELADSADPSRAAAAAETVATAHEIDTDSGVLSFRVAEGRTAMPEVVRAFDRADVEVRSAQIQRPTLDDVFLNLTGRRLRDHDD